MKVRFIFRKNGYLYCRMSYKKKLSVPFSTGYAIEQKRWDSKKQKTKDKLINEGLERIKTELLSIWHENKHLLPNDIKNIFLGKNTPVPSKNWLVEFMHLEEAKIESNQISRLTFINTRNHFKRFEEFLATTKLDYLTLTKNDISKLYNFLITTHKAGYIKILFTTVRRFYNMLEDLDIIQKKPFRNYRFPSFLRAKHLLNDEELEKIFSVNSPVARLFQIQVYTGLAYVDTQNFDSSWIVQKEGTHYLRYIRQKTAKKKQKFCISPIDAAALPLLEQVPKFAYSSYKKGLTELFKELGISSPPLTHTARKAYGNNLIKLGFSPNEISRYMGHSDLATTGDHYLDNEIYLTLRK